MNVLQPSRLMFVGVIVVGTLAFIYKMLTLPEDEFVVLALVSAAAFGLGYYLIKQDEDTIPVFFGGWYLSMLVYIPLFIFGTAIDYFCGK